MKYKAIIFDMDGTIINSEECWAQATLHLLMNKCNLSEKEALTFLPQFKGASSYSSCTFIKMAFQPKESIEQLIKEKDHYVFNNFAKLITFIKGFESFHKKITRLNIATAIATNAHQTALNKIKENVPLDQFFKEHIYCIDQVNKKAKPLPDVYLYAAQQLNIDPKDCIAIEDSSHGVAAAKAASMFCIGINSGNDRQALHQADLIVDHYDEIDLNKIPYHQ
ncbi:HAD family phosphatase [Candidatus Dependentiae bacterium]|nr:HAD family phosphatase [Candidatus Dependentiae bacterium]